MNTTSRIDPRSSHRQSLEHRQNLRSLSRARSRSLRRWVAGLALALGPAAVLAIPTVAHAEEGEGDSAAMSANRGLRVGLGPVLLVPTDKGPMGGGLSLDARYGIKAGPTVLAPGGELDGYFISRRFIGLAMPTFRITLPVGPLAPFVKGGVGGGWISNPSDGGLALSGGGGLMIHFGRIVAIGAELTYQTITNTEYKSLAIGPALSFGG